MTGKLDLFGWRKTEAVLESLSDACQDLLSFALAGRRAALGPQTQTVELSAHVTDNTHDLSIVVLFECLANGGQKNIQPQVINRNTLLLLGSVCPFSTVLVLGVFPLRTNAFLEEMVVGLLGELGGEGDVVLRHNQPSIQWRCKCTHVDAPELLD